MSSASISRPGFRLEKYHVILLVVLVTLTRIPDLQRLAGPTFEWRESDMASITRNFYRNGFNLLFPQIDWGGDGPGYVEMEFPIIPYAVALLYKIFGSHEQLVFLIPFLSNLGSVIVFYGLLKELYGPPTAFMGGTFLAFSPIMSYASVWFIPDPTMLFFSLSGVYLLVRWMRNGSWFSYSVSGFSVAMAILLKPTALILGIPILFLMYTKHGKKLFTQPAVWLFGVLSLVPPILWYSHAASLLRDYHNTFGILSGGMLKFATADLLRNPEFYELTFFRVLVFHLTPIVAGLCCVGLFVRQKSLERRLFHVWMAAILIYVVVVANGVMWGHYYLIWVNPPGAALAAVGTSSLVNRLKEWSASYSGRTKLFLAGGGVALFLVSVIASSLEFHLRRIPVDNYWEKEKLSGKVVKSLTGPGSQIIVVNSQMSDLKPEEIMTPPAVFYYSDRRGWYEASSWVNQALIENLESKGARYFVVSENYVDEFKSQNAPIYHYLRSRYKALKDDHAGLVVDLRDDRSDLTKRSNVDRMIARGSKTSDLNRNGQ